MFASADAFIRNQVGEHLQWLLPCCDPEKLRVGYERDLVQLWTIGLNDGLVMVFESQREPGRRRRRG